MSDTTHGDLMDALEPDWSDADGIVDGPTDWLFEPPPVEPAAPRPEREPWSGADPDPELGPGFTVLLLGTPIAFGAVYLAIFNAPAYWGPVGAGLLGGLFCVMYLAVFWTGSKWLQGHRRA